MVNVAHHRDDGRARHQVFGFVRLLDFVQDFFFVAHDLGLGAERTRDFGGDLAVERLVDGGEKSPVEQALDDVLGARVKLLREFLDRDPFADGDLARDRDFFRDNRPGRSETRPGHARRHRRTSQRRSNRRSRSSRGAKRHGSGRRRVHRPRLARPPLNVGPRRRAVRDALHWVNRLAGQKRF